MKRDPDIAEPKKPARATQRLVPADGRQGDGRRWLVRVWTRFASAIVQDLPAMLNECESCRETDCSRRRWELCRRRQEALLALTNGPGTPAPVHS